MARKLVVEIIGDASSLEKSYRQAEASTKRFGKNVSAQQTAIQKQGRAAGSAFLGFTPQQIGGAALGVALKQSVDAASDLNEQMNKTKVVFGQSSTAIIDWSESAAKAMGLSQRAALTAAATFGNLFSTVNIAKPAAAAMSRTLVQLASDMASFNDANPEDILNALRSGLVGEAEPLRIFGVRLTEVRVQQVAMADTGKTVAKSLTEQEKSMARYKIILADTKIQQGDFGKTSKDLANQQRTLRGNIEDLSAKIGGLFVPSLTNITGALNTAAGALDKFDKGQEKAMSDEDLKRIQNLGSAYQALKDKWLGGPLDPNAKQSARALGTGAFGVPRNAPMRAAPSGGFGANQQQKQFQFGGAFVATVEQQNRWFDAMIGRQLTDVQDIASVKAQVARLKEISAQITARIKVTSDITRKLTLEDQVKSIARMIRGDRADIAAEVARDAEAAAAAAKAAAAAVEAARSAAVQESFGWLDLSIARAATTKTMKDDLAAFKDQEAAIRAQIQQQGHTLQLETQLFDLQQARAQKVKEHAAELKQAAADRKQAADDLRKQAIQDRMGWLDFAVEQAEATKTLKDDRTALRRREAFLQSRIAHEGRTLELVSELWRTRQKIIDLNKKHTGDDALAGLTQVSSAKLTEILAAGTGLSGAGRRVLGANIAGAEIRPQHIHLHVDGREMTSVVTTHQARGSNRTARQTSGLRT